MRAAPSHGDGIPRNKGWGWGVERAARGTAPVSELQVPRLNQTHVLFLRLLDAAGKLLQKGPPGPLGDLAALPFPPHLFMQRRINRTLFTVRVPHGFVLKIQMCPSLGRPKINRRFQKGKERQTGAFELVVELFQKGGL